MAKSRTSPILDRRGRFRPPFGPTRMLGTREGDLLEEELYRQNRASMPAAAQEGDGVVVPMSRLLAVLVANDIKHISNTVQKSNGKHTFKLKRRGPHLRSRPYANSTFPPVSTFTNGETVTHQRTFENSQTPETCLKRVWMQVERVCSTCIECRTLGP